MCVKAPEDDASETSKSVERDIKKVLSIVGDRYILNNNTR